MEEQVEKQTSFICTFLDLFLVTRSYGIRNIIVAINYLKSFSLAATPLPGMLSHPDDHHHRIMSLEIVSPFAMSLA